MVRDGRVGQDSISCGRIRGGGYVWMWGAMLHSSRSSIPPPPKKCCQSPNATISVLSLQEHQEATPKASTPAMMKLELAPEVPSPAAPEAAEEVIPTHMSPLFLELEGIKRV